MHPSGRAWKMQLKLELASFNCWISQGFLLIIMGSIAGNFKLEKYSEVHRKKKGKLQLHLVNKKISSRNHLILQADYKMDFPSTNLFNFKWKMRKLRKTVENCKPKRCGKWRANFLMMIIDWLIDCFIGNAKETKLTFWELYLGIIAQFTHN